MLTNSIDKSRQNQFFESLCSALDDQGHNNLAKVFNFYTHKQITNYAKQRVDICLSVIEQSNTINECNFSTVTSNDLAMIFAQYDTLFFNQQLGEIAENLEFRVSKIMFSKVGSLMYQPTQQILTISHWLIMNAFHNSNEKIRINGYDCNNRLECLLLIIEHEIIHLILFIAGLHSSCTGNNFDILARFLFSHSEHNHHLETPADKLYKEKGLKLGDIASFKYQGEKLTGKIRRIRNKISVESDKRRYLLENKNFYHQSSQS